MCQADFLKAAKSKDNPFFKSKYADLEAVIDSCRPALQKNNISILQAPMVHEGRVYVETRLLHKSGEWISSSLSAKPKDEGPQSIGSCISFLRRYGLSALLCLATEDDDGNSAQAQETTTRPGTPNEKYIGSTYEGKSSQEKNKLAKMMEGMGIKKENFAEVAKNMVGRTWDAVEHECADYAKYIKQVQTEIHGA
jgi:hypothetical protein